MTVSIDHLVAGTVLEPYKAVLEQAMTPGVGFGLCEHINDGPGTSRLGGVADVPVGFEMPVNKGRQLDLLLQINLRDIPRHGLAALLPEQGLLSFFYDLKEQPWGFDPGDLAGFGVCFFPDSNALVKSDGPMSEDALKPVAMDFWPNWSLPDSESVEGEQMFSHILPAEVPVKVLKQRWWQRLFRQILTANGSDARFDEIHEALHAIRDQLHEMHAPAESDSCHQIGGYSNNIQGDMQLEAQLVMNGLNCGDGSGYSDPRAKVLEASRDDWQLLLQLDSDEERGQFMWGDCGRLYFWIRKQDLAKADFSHVWMSLQCS